MPTKRNLLNKLQVHLREDFEPWIPIDIGMDREERNRIFEKAGVRKTPMLFIDDQYVGDYDDVSALLLQNSNFNILEAIVISSTVFMRYR